MDNQDQNQDAPLKVTINGQEYDPTEAQEYIEKGRMAKEYEQKWNTSLDKVWPAYGESQGKLKQLESERDQAKKELAEFQSKQQQGTETQQDVLDAKDAARKLGLAFNEDLEKGGYIKKDELPSLIQNALSEQKAIESLDKEGDKYAKELDGTDGRPKYNKKAVLAYASAFKKGTLMEAYEEMHSDDLAVWKKEQIDAQRNPGLKTLKGSGGEKQPKTVKVTDANVKDLLRETLGGSQE